MKPLVITIDKVKKIGFGAIIGIGVYVLLLVSAFVLEELADSYSLEDPLMVIYGAFTIGVFAWYWNQKKS